MKRLVTLFLVLLTIQSKAQYTDSLVAEVKAELIRLADFFTTENCQYFLTQGKKNKYTIWALKPESKQFEKLFTKEYAGNLSYNQHDDGSITAFWSSWKKSYILRIRENRLIELDSLKGTGTGLVTDSLVYIGRNSTDLLVYNIRKKSVKVKKLKESFIPILSCADTLFYWSYSDSSIHSLVHTTDLDFKLEGKEYFRYKNLKFIKHKNAVYYIKDSSLYSVTGTNKSVNTVTITNEKLVELESKPFGLVYYTAGKTYFYYPNRQKSVMAYKGRNHFRRVYVSQNLFFELRSHFFGYDLLNNDSGYVSNHTVSSDVYVVDSIQECIYTQRTNEFGHTIKVIDNELWSHQIQRFWGEEGYRIGDIFMHKGYLHYIYYCDSIFAIHKLTKPTITSVINHQKTVEVYPNPVSEQLDLEGIDDFCSIEILNLNGQLLASFNYDINPIDVAFLQPGSYIIRFVNADFVGQKVFIKQ
jgi:hypothetical protein